ncbi:hypothetical protein TNIN_162501 [Trichonephila inaurata madagascariensis]|uniref:Secreted protein n=1 Tax=Trichonephila inaurata madagascariensis TaxID=2747483 RepID=A0A8X7BRH4_9ARAC|nr:hypothetical protein TNIN_162501 [Trichonephila inaurata madagascariensis]
MYRGQKKRVKLNFFKLILIFLSVCCRECINTTKHINNSSLNAFRISFTIYFRFSDPNRFKSPVAFGDLLRITFTPMLIS